MRRGLAGAPKPELDAQQCRDRGDYPLGRGILGRLPLPDFATVPAGDASLAAAQATVAAATAAAAAAAALALAAATAATATLVTFVYDGRG